MKHLYAEFDNVQVLYCFFLNGKYKFYLLKREFKNHYPFRTLYPGGILLKTLSKAVMRVNTHPP
jgi:hypothetical protein